MPFVSHQRYFPLSLLHEQGFRGNFSKVSKSPLWQQVSVLVYFYLFFFWWQSKMFDFSVTFLLAMITEHKWAGWFIDPGEGVQLHFLKECAPVLNKYYVMLLINTNFSLACYLAFFVSAIYSSSSGACFPWEVQHLCNVHFCTD